MSSNYFNTAYQIGDGVHIAHIPHATCFELTNEWLLASAVQVIPDFVGVLHCTILIAGIIGFSSVPRSVWCISSQWRLPSSFLPLVTESNPTIGHESSDNISCPLVPDDSKITTLSSADVLSIIPVFTFTMVFVVVSICSSSISTGDFWLRRRRRWRCSS